MQDNVQNDDVEGVGEGGIVELAPVGLPPPEQGDVRKRTTVRLVLPASSSKQETEEISEPADTQPKLSFKRKQKGDKKLGSAKCESKTDDSSSTGSKGSPGEETITYETAL